MHSRDYHLKKARLNNTQQDWSTYKRLRNTVTYSLKRSKANYYRTLLNESCDQPKLFWKNIKKVFSTKSGNKETSSTMKIGDTITNDKSLIANGFCNYFTNVAKSLLNKVTTVYNRTWKVYDNEHMVNNINLKNSRFEFSNVSVSSIENQLKVIKTKKAAGPDNITATMIKDVSRELAYPLCFLINLSLQKGIFPSVEKVAKVTPIYKAEEKTLFDNYRPISVLNIVSKVIEKVIYMQLIHYLETNKLLNQHQFGFRPKKCTQDAVLFLSDFIRQNMDQGNLTGALYLDLRKAFDTVSHSCLINKLPYYGINNKELCWISDYLFNRTQYVNYNQHTSSVNSLSYGVPQGSILGPLLFVILINDVPSSLVKCNILMYADDAVIFCSGSSTKMIQNTIVDDGENIFRWFQQNDLILNLKKSKTEFILYGTPQKLRNQEKCNIIIKGTNIAQSTKYEYLGVILDQHLTFNDQINKIYKKASNRLHLLNRIRCNVNPYSALSIYHSMIEPIIMYCSPLYLGISNTA